MRKLLLLLLVCGLSGFGIAQSTVTRQVESSDESLQAAHRSLENQLIVEEIEVAGFEIDVEEGFDEEWEEDIWVSAEADDLSANYTDPTEAARFDIDEVPQADEVADDWSDESWENPDLLTEIEENAVAMVDEATQDYGSMRGDDEAQMEDTDSYEDVDATIGDEMSWAEEAETELSESNWWEESTEQWTAVVDEMDFDAFDSMDEEEDLDLLEELYGVY